MSVVGKPGKLDRLEVDVDDACDTKDGREEGVVSSVSEGAVLSAILVFCRLDEEEDA